MEGGEDESVMAVEDPNHCDQTTHHGDDGAGDGLHHGRDDGAGDGLHHDQRRSKTAQAPDTPATHTATYVAGLDIQDGMPTLTVAEGAPAMAPAPTPVAPAPAPVGAVPQPNAGPMELQCFQDPAFSTCPPVMQRMLLMQARQTDSSGNSSKRRTRPC